MIVKVPRGFSALRQDDLYSELSEGSAREGRGATVSLAPQGRKVPGGPRFSLASLGTNTCFLCQPRTARTRGSGPRPTAAVAAAPSSLMASAEQARKSRGSGSV